MAAAGGGVRDGLAYLEAPPDLQAVMLAITDRAEDFIELRLNRGVGSIYGAKPVG